LELKIIKKHVYLIYFSEKSLINKGKIKK
jgi:hypothetical protein